MDGLDNTYISLSDSDDEEEVDKSIDLDEVDKKIDRARERRTLLQSVKAAHAAMRNFEERTARENEIATMKKALDKRIAKEDKRRRETLPPGTSGASRTASAMARYHDVKAHSDSIFGTASRSIARILHEEMKKEGHPGLVSSEAVPEKTIAVDPELRYESELEFAVMPEKLVVGQWKEIKKWPDLSSAKGFKEGLTVLNDKIDRLMRVQSLHTIAHLSVLKATRMTSLLCVRDGPAKDDVYWQLQASLRAVVLASDADLQAIPFQDPEALHKFFRCKKRIEKLAFFLLTYVEFKKGFPQTLTRTLFSPHMQRISYWQGTDQSKG